MERLKQLLERENKKIFLDIGTGGGNFIHLIKSKYDDYDKMIGIDTIDRAIEAAKKNFDDKRIEFKVMDAYNMEFDDNTFDVVMLSNSLHHLDDIDGMLKEMKRVVKEDGFIIVSEMISNKLNNKQESHKMLHHFSAKLDKLRGDIHHETFTDEEIIQHLTNSNIFTLKENWFMDVPRVTENTKEEIDYIMNLVDRVSERIPEDRDDLLKEKEEIKKYIVENGYDGCTTQISILYK